MLPNTLQQLIDQHQANNEHWQHDEVAMQAALATDASQQQPTYIKAITIIGGFFATLFLLGFLTSAGLYNSPNALVVVGTLLVAGGVYVDRQQLHLMLETMAITAVLFGSFMLLFGLQESINDDTIILFSTFFFAAIFAAAGGYLLRFLGAVAALLCLPALALEKDSGAGLHVCLIGMATALMLLHQQEASLLKAGKWIASRLPSLQLALAVALLIALFVPGKSGIMPKAQPYAVACGGCMLVLLGIASWQMPALKRLGKWIPMAIVAALAGTVFNPAIGGSVLVALLGFGYGYRTSWWLGLAAMLYYVSQYYYDLSWTLLQKSIMMAATGVVLLLFYYFAFGKNKQA
ncbi:MAG: DUF4401 domain-containing protein [Chitinophagaceae bacterium]|jgi:hypothetical protein|nr:DUF4401 domain-containing protein [Chitinophagaceae bacterium]